MKKQHLSEAYLSSLFVPNDTITSNVLLLSLPLPTLIYSLLLRLSTVEGKTFIFVSYFMLPKYKHILFTILGLL